MGLVTRSRVNKTRVARIFASTTGSEQGPAEKHLLNQTEPGFEYDSSEQGVYEFPTGPSGAYKGDGYCYALDLNVDPVDDMYDLDTIYGGWDE